MNVGGSNSIASQVYSGVQNRLSPDNAKNNKPGQGSIAQQSSGFQLPSNATPRGNWVLSEGTNPQSFDPGAPRGSYLNVVV